MLFRSIGATGYIGATGFTGATGSGLTGATGFIGATGSGGSATYTYQTSNFTATANSYYWLGATNITATLPASPSKDSFVVVANGSTGPLTGCVIGRNSQLIMGIAEDLSLDNPFFVVRLVYNYGATGMWNIGD